ncbi:MAG TPA: 2-oxo acid dehydrogenase subunit E2 [Trueperaceae bacterium]|nr:2-oxo acid dehydrogenase subunit E2 [Trueperaceae bacterium]
MATEVTLPDVGEGIESGTVVGVLVKEGDRINKDQPVVELETDKAVVEVPSTVAGVVKQVNVKEGEEAKIGAVLVIIEEGEGEGEGAGAGEPEPVKAEPEQQAASEKQEEPEPAGPEQAKPETARAGASEVGSQPRQEPAGGRSGARPGAAAGQEEREDHDRLVPAAPSVRRLARELGVDIHHVNGSGVLGRISASDVRSASSGAGSLVAPAVGQTTSAPLPDFSRYGETERIAMSGVRKATLKAMTRAWGTVPLVTHFDDADITELEKLRMRYQPLADEVGAKLTPTAILLKVVAVALKRFPDFNASIDVDKLEVVRKLYINVGVAVDTDAGLLVPVVKDADKKGMIELAKELGELAEKARDRKLSLEEMQGGNFSISNLGGIGGVGFTPIVTPPEVAILGVSRARVEPVWNKESAVFEPRTVMPLALSYDHRLIDGAAAARFLRWVCMALEEPFLVALEG